MSKLYKENGLLSDHGVHVTHPVKMALYKLLNQHEDIKVLSELELRDLGGALQKIVGDAISERVNFKNEVQKKLDAMNDERFTGYLKAKYGSRWMLQSLSTEELERLPPASTDKCSGSWWNDEYGNESFQHNEFSYCPVHDKK